MSLPIITASGEVRGGKLRIRDRATFDESLRTLRDGLQVEVEITRLLATRSPQQNKYYWGVVIQSLCDLSGYAPQEMHDICKLQFIPKHLGVTRATGDVVAEFTLGGSTRTLTTIEFQNYCEQIKQWAAAELDVYIPDPDERGYGAGV